MSKKKKEVSKEEKSITITKLKDGTTKTEFINCTEYDNEMMDLLITAANMYLDLDPTDSRRYTLA